LNDKKLFKTIPRNFKYIDPEKLFFKNKKNSFIKSIINPNEFKYLNNKNNEIINSSSKNNLDIYKEYFKNDSIKIKKSTTISNFTNDSYKNLINEEFSISNDKKHHNKTSNAEIKKRSIFNFFKKAFCNDIGFMDDISNRKLSIRNCIKELLDIRRFLLLQIKYNEFFNFVLHIYSQNKSILRNSIDSLDSLESLVDQSINS